MKRIVVLALSFLLILSSLLACGKEKKTIYDNEKDAFVMSIGEMDEVFNPFFVTSGNDTQVIGLTQLGMLSTDSNGNLVAGDEWDSVARDYSIDNTHNTPNPQDENDFTNYYTTYEFLLKNNLVFSDNSPLTYKDVLFNFYVYLDPSYIGSTTMYSTKIRGLTEYRTQTDSPEAAAAKEQDFIRDGNARVVSLLNRANNKQLSNETLTGDVKIVADLFLDELNTDWNAAASALEDYEKKVPAINTVWKAFFVMQGYIELEKRDGVEQVKEWGGFENPAFITQGMSDDALKTACINVVYNTEIKNAEHDDFNANIAFILKYRAAGSAAAEYFTADEKKNYFEQVKLNNDGRLYTESIEGIKIVPNVTTFKNKTLDAPHDVLRIVVNGVDPKAIYNFSIPIAPMKYYGGDYARDNFNGTTNFGVDYGSIDFMYNTVRAQDVPVGAGPYKATDVNNTDNGSIVPKNRFVSNNVVYYIRNDKFLLGAPKIKFVRYKVITRTQLMDSLVLGEVHLGDPDAKTENYNKINANNSYLGYADPMNLGYGYIGINAKYVPDINVRRAIMYAMDVGLALEYYTNGSAVTIYRPMSMESWAYPEGATPVYPFDGTGAKSYDCIKNDYQKGSDGKLKNVAGDRLKYTFTVAGSSDDHPMYNAMRKAANILNELGFEIEVTTDPNAIRKLNSGLLEVWAAAWGSTLDPDMYQVYHKDSKATSIQNWGFKDILDGVKADIYPHRTIEAQWINELADIIDSARKTTVQADRAPLYHQALNKIMDLAVELPTYQRKNLFVYNKNVIDESTLSSDVSAFSSLIAKIWELSLVVE